jgi:predicted nucleotidyltransferase
MPESKLVAVLKDLCRRDIRFVVVGGLAAILHGAPGQTLDIDLVFSRDPENIQRLLDFLGEADAIFRIQPHRRLRPNESHLAGGGHLNLLTRYGPVDLLGTIGNNLGYADLASHSNEMDIGQGLRIQVLDLETIIAVKEQLGSAKDLAALPALYQTLRQMKKSG